jgi:hypothetical protein
MRPSQNPSSPQFQALQALHHEDQKPALLALPEMTVKLAELGIHPASTLGQHALRGGPLYDVVGHYRLATKANLARFAEAGASASNRSNAVVASAQRESKTLADHVADAYEGTPEQVVTTQAVALKSGARVRMTTLDATANAFCGPEELSK